jgi:hypothetical protein
VDFFKTLYFLRGSANISLIDQKRLSDGTDCSRMDRERRQRESLSTDA